MTAVTVDALVALGYTVTVAYGDAGPERDRLAELREAATPAAVAGRAGEFTDAAAVHARELGLKGPEAVAAISEAYSRAFSHFGERATAAVAHQQRAVEVAESMATVFRVEGFGLSVLVAEDDAVTLAALTDAAAHEERVAQHDCP